MELEQNSLAHARVTLLVLDLLLVSSLAVQHTPINLRVSCC